MGAREELMRDLAARIAAARSQHPLRIGVDGCCGAGKTVFARDLTSALRQHRVDAVHLQSDGFHNVRAIRYRRGRESARGYYEDAYDFEALAERVLRPLGPGGTFEYAQRVHDLETDAVIENDCAVASPDAVVVFDCTFLQRGALRELWDEVIYLDVDRSVSVHRGVSRDADRLGGHKAAHTAYETRYMAACDIYLAEERPRERASIVINHDEPHSPSVQRVAARINTPDRCIHEQAEA